MRLFVKIIFFLLFSTSAWAATPVIFYSDLTSGPKIGGVNNKGVFVTIWGKGFGATQGTSTVALGGGNADNYPTWSDTMICFQLGASVATGSITVTTSAGTSNGVPFTVRSGRIQFIDPTQGSNGTGTFASPFNHIYYAYNQQQIGDTYYIRAGTITNEYAGRYGYHSILAEDLSATQANPIAFVAYPNETVTLNATDSASTFPDSTDTISYVFRDANGLSAYITVSKFTMTSTSTFTNGANPAVFWGVGWRVVGNKVTTHNEPYGTFAEGGGTNSYILGNEVLNSFDDSYVNTAHSIYWDGVSNNTEIGWNYIHNNHNTGNEISVYHNGPKIGSIHDNLIVATNPGDVRGMLVAGCTDDPSGIDRNTTTETNVIKVYNNILVNVGIANLGGAIQASCGTAYIYNNTIYQSQELKGVMQFFGGLGPGGGPPVWYVADNIIYANTPGLYISDGNGSAPAWSNFAVLSDNIYFGEGNGPTQDADPLNLDPLFVSNGTNFHLQSTSQAIGQGYNTNSIVASDYDGITRPNPPAVGAYEYSTGSNCTANGGPSTPGPCCSGFSSGGTCVAYICGDGIVTSPEVCDTSGPNLNGQTCVSQGFSAGSLACNSGCLSFNTSSCTAPAFPTTPILDTFTRVDNLTTLGTNWTLDATRNDPMGIIVNNAYLPNSINNALQYWNPNTFTGKIEGYVTVNALQSSGSGAQVWLLTDTSSHNGYGVFSNYSAGNIAVARIDAFTTTVLVTKALTFSAGDSLGFSYNTLTGNITLWYKSGSSGWVSEGTATDTTYPTVKYLGMQQGNTHVYVSNFGGGGVTAAAAVPAGETLKGNLSNKKVTFK